MWVSIFVARNERDAERIMERLDGGGIINRLKPVADSSRKEHLEIQVLESDAQDAQQFCY